MPNIYCPSCGLETKYLFQKPEHCSSCKFIFASYISPKEKEKPKVYKTKRREEIYNENDEEDEYDESFSEPFRSRKNLTLNLKVKIEKPQFEQLKNVIGSNPGEERQSRAKIDKDSLKNKIFKAQPSSLD